MGGPDTPPCKIHGRGFVMCDRCGAIGGQCRCAELRTTHRLLLDIEAAGSRVIEAAKEWRLIRSGFWEGTERQLPDGSERVPTRNDRNESETKLRRAIVALETLEAQRGTGSWSEPSDPTD
jgi:hypothetical protein